MSTYFSFLWFNFWDRLTAVLKVTHFAHAIVATIGLEVTAMFFTISFSHIFSTDTHRPEHQADSLFEINSYLCCLSINYLFIFVCNLCCVIVFVCLSIYYICS